MNEICSTSSIVALDVDRRSWITPSAVNKPTWRNYLDKIHFLRRYFRSSASVLFPVTAKVNWLQELVFKIPTSAIKYWPSCNPNPRSSYWSGTFPGLAPLAVRTSSRGSDQSQLIAICALTDLTKEALPSSFLIEAFWVSTFTSGTFVWCSSLWLSRIPCSGICVTTTLL